jgi:hypothetical protein
MYEHKMLLKEYFDHLRKYEQMYGENVAVLMQVGHFYEVYGVDNEIYKVGKTWKSRQLDPIGPQWTNN